MKKIKLADNKRTKTLTKIDRSTVGLRNMMFEELDNLRGGKTTPSCANAIARNVSAIIGTVRLEMDYHSLKIAQKHAGPLLLGS